MFIRRISLSRACACVLICVLTHSSPAQIPPAGGYLIKIASLTGEGYDRGTSGLHRESTVFHLNNNGATGLSSRFAADGSSLGTDAWYVASGSGGLAINPSGGVYERSTPAGIIRSAGLFGLNNAGQVLGDASRYAPDGTGIGRDAWLYPGSGSAVIVGLSGPEYQYAIASGIARTSEPAALGDGGHAIGTSGRFTTAGTEIGQDAWLSDAARNTMLIGLVGAGYERPESGGIRRVSSAGAVNLLGQAIGLSTRYGASGSSVGYDGWFYDGGGNTIPIGLTGAPYEHTNTVGELVRTNRPSFLNNAGDVAGTTDIAHSNGSDAWVRRGPTGTAQLISLTGTGYEYSNSAGLVRNAAATALTADGTVVGSNVRYASNGLNRGQDVWLWAESGGTRIINLVGPEYEQTLPVNTRSSTIIEVNGSGWVLGSTDRRGTGTGNDIWTADASSPTRRVNLIGDDYEYNNGTTIRRQAAGVAISSTGAAIGISERFDPVGGSLGIDAWYSDSSGTSRRINLVGPNYQYTDSSGGVVRSGLPLAMNQHEQVLGRSARLDSLGNPLGQAGWFFDPVTGITTALEFSFRADGRCDTFPTLVSGEGVVLGTYNFYEDGHPAVNRVFWWSQDAGKHDLGDLVAGGLSAAGWSTLRTVFNPMVPGAIGQTADGAPFYIMGNGLTNDQISGQTIYLLSAVVPEPAVALGSALFCFQILGLGRRQPLRGRSTRLISQHAYAAPRPFARSR